jgi:hypothetical protein
MDVTERGAALFDQADEPSPTAPAPPQWRPSGSCGDATSSMGPRRDCSTSAGGSNADFVAEDG